MSFQSQNNTMSHKKRKNKAHVCSSIHKRWHTKAQKARQRHAVLVEGCKGEKAGGRRGSTLFRHLCSDGACMACMQRYKGGRRGKGGVGRWWWYRVSQRCKQGGRRLLCAGREGRRARWWQVIRPGVGG